MGPLNGVGRKVAAGVVVVALGVLALGVSPASAAPPVLDSDYAWPESSALPGEVRGVKAPNNVAGVFPPGETSLAMEGVGGIGDVSFPASEVTVEVVEVVGGNFYEQAMVTLPADMAPGAYYVRATTPDGTSNRVVLYVGNYHCINQVMPGIFHDVDLSFAVEGPGEVEVGEPIVLDSIIVTMAWPEVPELFGSPMEYPQGDIYWVEGETSFFGANTSVAVNQDWPLNAIDPAVDFGSTVTWEIADVTFPGLSEPGTFEAVPEEWRFIIDTPLSAFGYICTPYQEGPIATVEVVDPPVSTTTTAPPDGSTTTTTQSPSSSTTAPGGGSGGGSGSGSSGGSSGGGTATPRYTG